MMKEELFPQRPGKRPHNTGATYRFGMPLLVLCLACILLLPDHGFAWGKKNPPAESKKSEPAAPAERKFTVLYQAITAVGLFDQLSARVASGTEVIKSSDGRTGYVVRKVPVENAEQLIHLMGATSTAGLSDGQKGLLEVFKYSTENRVKSYLPLLPIATGTVQIELTDTTGFDDATRYPTVRSDFWPRNSKTSWTLDGKITQVDINIKMSPVDCSSYGQDAAVQMKSTFVHEFAHSFDLTSGEPDGYGPDGTHYINEVIKEKASFIEGFAVFHQLLADPSLVPTYRWNLKQIKYETASGCHDVDAKSAAVTGMDLTRVEGVQALTLLRFAQEIPNGREKIYAAFRVANGPDKTFSTFLKEFIKQHVYSV